MSMHWCVGGSGQSSYRMEGGSSWGRCLDVSVPSSVVATAAATSGPSHIKAFTSFGFGWIRPWARELDPLAVASLRRPVRDCSLPTSGMGRDLEQGQGGRLLDFLDISDCPPTPPPPHPCHRISLLGSQSPISFLHCQPYLQLLL